MDYVHFETFVVHLLALQRLDERRLLAADVGARAVVDVQVEVVAAAARVLAQEALGIRLVQRPLQRLALIDILAPADGMTGMLLSLL